MSTRIFIIVLIILGLAGGYLFLNRTTNLERQYEAEAKLSANAIQVKSFAIGQIDEIFISEGDFVEEGQKLITINTILGRVGDNTSGGTIIDGTTSSTVFAPQKGLISELLVTSGDSIELYANLLNIIDTTSYNLEVKIRKDWVDASKIFTIGDEILWIDPSINQTNTANISYIYPYLIEDEIKFKVKLSKKPDNLFINQKIKVLFK